MNIDLTDLGPSNSSLDLTDLGPSNSSTGNNYWEQVGESSIGEIRNIGKGIYEIGKRFGKAAVLAPSFPRAMLSNALFKKDISLYEKTGQELLDILPTKVIPWAYRTATNPSDISNVNNIPQSIKETGTVFAKSFLSPKESFRERPIGTTADIATVLFPLSNVARKSFLSASKNVAESAGMKSLGFLKKLRKNPQMVKQAKEATRLALDEGIISPLANPETMLERANIINEKAGKNIGSFLSSQKNYFKWNKAIDDLDNLKKELPADPDIENKINSVQQIIINTAKRYNGKISFEEANKLKTYIQEKVPWNTDKASANVGKMVAGTFKNSIDKQLASITDLNPIIKTAFSKYKELVPNVVTSDITAFDLLNQQSIPRELANQNLKNIRISVVDTPGMNPKSRGMYNEGSNTILIKKGLTEEQFNEVLSHELKHAIDFNLNKQLPIKDAEDLAYSYTRENPRSLTSGNKSNSLFNKFLEDKKIFGKSETIKNALNERVSQKGNNWLGLTDYLSGTGTGVIISGTGVGSIESLLMGLGSAIASKYLRSYGPQTIASVANRIAKILSDSPYSKALQIAAEKGTPGLIAAHNYLEQTDSDYSNIIRQIIKSPEIEKLSIISSKKAAQLPSKKLTEEIAIKFLEKANDDPDLARQYALLAGYDLGTL